MLKQHGKKIAGFGALGAVLPFLVGADADPSIFTGDSGSLWLLLLKLAAAAIAPAATMIGGLVVAAAGAALVAYGRAKLTDKDPANDALGAAFVAAGRRLSPNADADAVLTPPDGSRPLLAATSTTPAPQALPPKTP